MLFLSSLEIMSYSTYNSNMIAFMFCVLILWWSVQHKSNFNQSKYCSFSLITRGVWGSWFLWQPKVRWPVYVLLSCSCAINRLFVNRMAKHSLTRFQVHKVWGNWVKGQRWKVISHFGYVLLWSLWLPFRLRSWKKFIHRPFAKRLVRIGSGRILLPNLLPHFLSLCLSCVLLSEIYKNAKNFIKLSI